MKNVKEQAVSDVVTQKPINLSVGSQSFKIHPPTLGKMQILSKLYLQLEINEDTFINEPYKEVMRIAESKIDIICQLMAIATFNTSNEMLDDEKITERADFFKWNCQPENFSACIVAILTQVDYSNFMTSIRLTKMLRQNKPSSEGAVRVE